MTLIVKSNTENTISLPDWLMKHLNLHEGEAVKTIVEGKTLRLTPLDQFLSLRGVFKNDEGFDEAMKHIETAWQSWTFPESV